MTVSKPFADILSARRQTFNNIVQTARTRTSSFDTEAFSNFLNTDVDAIIQAVCDVDPERSGSITEDVFEMAVNLVAQRRVGAGARDDLINRIWRDVAPRIPKLISIDALESLGALTNSATYVSAQDGLRADDWVKSLQDLAPKLDSIQHLRELVTVSTWRSGGAHVRPVALLAAAALPPEIAAAVIGVSKKRDIDDALKRFMADIWWTPDGLKPSTGHTVGGFAGLGGPFNVPPNVRAIDDGFLVRSADAYFHLSVDAFGAIVQSAQEDDWVDANVGLSRGAEKDLDRITGVDNVTLGMTMPEEGLKFCSNRASIAMFSPHSHFILVFPRRGRS